MHWYNYIGIILSLISIFSGFCAFFLYFRVKKLYSLLTEEQLEEATPIILQQHKRIKKFLIVCLILGIIGVILMLI